MNKKTKIVATLGPSTDSEAVIRELIESGVNIFRLNFSHGTHDEHRDRLEKVRRIAKELGVHVGVLQDLGGPKIRIGDFRDGSVVLEEGKQLTLTTKKVAGTVEKVYVNYEKLPQEVSVNGRLLLDDGKVELKVLRVEGDEVHTTVIHGGEIKSRRGVNAPGSNLSIPTLTDKDKEDLRFSEDLPDFVALSFVRSAEDIELLRAELKEVGSSAAIIAKIETLQATEDIDNIIRATDALMVARGDLAVEIPAEEVPFQQKALISKCREFGKPVIVATQMFESMITNAVPTRAEMSDVANAILDGTDAIMLSGETAIGAHPVEAVQVMARVAVRTERESAVGILNYKEISEDGTGAITSGILGLSRESGAAAIVTLTEGGSTARKVSRHRLHVPVVALTPHEKTARRLTIAFGVESLVVDAFTSLDDVLARVPVLLRRGQGIPEGSRVLLTTGTKFGSSGATNTIMMLQV